MTFWKPAIMGASLGLAMIVAACQPVGVPMGEQRLAEKIADAMITPQELRGIAMQQMQGMMGAVPQDQMAQVGIAMGRELEAKLPDVKKTMVEGLTREFNIKELEFFHDQLTSQYAQAVAEKQQAALAGAGEQLQAFAQEAAQRAIAKVGSAWPTAQPAAPPQPELPPGMVLPN